MTGGSNNGMGISCLIEEETERHKRNGGACFNLAVPVPKSRTDVGVEARLQLLRQDTVSECLRKLFSSDIP